MYIPEGYGTVFPYIIVSDAEKLMNFLATAIGAYSSQSSGSASGQ